MTLLERGCASEAPETEGDRQRDDGDDGNDFPGHEGAAGEGGGADDGCGRGGPCGQIAERCAEEGKQARAPVGSRVPIEAAAQAFETLAVAPAERVLREPQAFCGFADRKPLLVEKHQRGAVRLVHPAQLLEHDAEEFVAFEHGGCVDLLRPSGSLFAPPQP